MDANPTEKKSILIVEDNQAIRDMMRSLLEIEGYDVFAAANGAEGIEILKSHPDMHLILLDMMMPVMNGWYFLDFQRGQEEYAKIPVVVVSAFGEIARSVRPHAFIPKPIQLDSLLKTVQELCVA